MSTLSSMLMSKTQNIENTTEQFSSITTSSSTIESQVPSSIEGLYLVVLLPPGSFTCSLTCSSGSSRFTEEAAQLCVWDPSSESISCCTESRSHLPEVSDPYTYRHISPAVNSLCLKIKQRTWVIHDPFWRLCWQCFPTMQCINAMH